MNDEALQVAKLAAADQLVAHFDEILRQFFAVHEDLPLGDRAHAWSHIADEVHGIYMEEPHDVVLLASSALLRLLEMKANQLPGDLADESRN